VSCPDGASFAPRSYLAAPTVPDRFGGTPVDAGLDVLMASPPPDLSVSGLNWITPLDGDTTVRDHICSDSLFAILHRLTP
jgi:hypothetical protein